MVTWNSVPSSLPHAFKFIAAMGQRMWGPGEGPER